MFGRKIFKKIILIIATFGLVAGSLLSFYVNHFGQKNEQPITFTHEDDRFNVQFPSDPQKSEEELTIANKKIEFHQFTSAKEDAEYAVSYLDFPGHWKLFGTEKMLSKSFETFLENQENVEQVLQNQLTTHQGNPAIKYRLKQAGKEVWGKFVVVGNTLYRVTVTCPASMVEKINPTNFIESFSPNS